MAAPARFDLAAIDAMGAANVLKQIAAARLICFPTDTVYGLGGPLRPAVVDAIVRVKGREPHKPLQVIFPTLAALEAALAPPPRLAAALDRLLPGGVTLVVPYPANLTCPPPGSGLGGVPTLGVRVPEWPPAARLLARLGEPLVASSANESGQPAARSLSEVPERLRAACDVLLDAGPLGGTASTVIDLSDYAERGEWRILREGALSRRAVAAVLGRRGERNDRETSGCPLGERPV